MYRVAASIILDSNNSPFMAAQAPFSQLLVHGHISWELDTMVWSTGCDNTHIHSPDHSWSNQVLFLDVYSLD